MAKSFSTHVAALRQERMGLLGDRRVAQAGIGNLRGQAKGEVCALNTRRIEELDARLHAALELLLPENVLDALASSLGQPEQLLRLESVELAVDRAGVLLEPAASGTSLDAKPIEFLELTSRDRRRHVAVLVRVQRADAASSVVAAEARRDRFLII
jgi:hypothetical protein